MRMKRTIAMLLGAMVVCALCVTALPKTAQAAVDYTMEFSMSGPVDWHNGVPIDYSDEDDQDTGWAWAHSTKTLTLSGLQFETIHPVAMRLPADATIVLMNGTANTLTANPPPGYASNIDSVGIGCIGALTITGGGTLTVAGGSRQDPNRNSCGVNTNGNITINGGTLVAKANFSESGTSYGVYPDSVIVNGGRFVAQGHTKALQGLLTLGSAAITARGSVEYDGANLVDYDFSADPPQQYVTAYGQSAPKTGDDTPLMLLVGLALLSCAGIAVFLTARRRKQA